MAVAPTGRWAMVIDSDDSTHRIDIDWVTDIKVWKPKGNDGKWRRKAG
jgi:hypothetical protein